MTEATMWSTDGVESTTALEAWRQKMPELHLDWALSCPPEEPFAAKVRYRRMDSLTIADFRGGRYAGVRPTEQQPSDGPALIGVIINLRGRLVCHYADREVTLRAGEMMVWDSEFAQGFAAVEPHRELSIMLPRDGTQALGTVRAQTGSVISVRRGSGLPAIAAAQLREMTEELDTLSDPNLAVACQAFFYTLDAALAAPALRTGTSARADLLERVRRHIEAHLDDPNLCASSIAAAHGISVRSLHLLFADTGTTVSRWIRGRRLDMCYLELSHARTGKTVTDIAFHWGFNDSAHFSRSFKQAFGVTPSSVLPTRTPVVTACAN